MGVKIELTLDIQNKELFQNAYLMVMSAETLATTSQNSENLSFSLSKLNDIHGKLNTTEFCYNFCRI